MQGQLGGVDRIGSDECRRVLLKCTIKLILDICFLLLKKLRISLEMCPSEPQLHNNTVTLLKRQQLKLDMTNSSGGRMKHSTGTKQTL